MISRIAVLVMISLVFLFSSYEFVTDIMPQETPQVVEKVHIDTSNLEQILAETESSINDLDEEELLGNDYHLILNYYRQTQVMVISELNRIKKLDN